MNYINLKTGNRGVTATMIAQSPSCAPIAPSSSSGSSSFAPTQLPIAMAKGVEENMALMAGFMNCYNAFVAGEVAPPMVIGEIVSRGKKFEFSCREDRKP